MDGGSTDESPTLIRAHAEANPGLVTHWRSKPDGGQSSAINEGFALARGAFGAWLNADDWYEPGSLARVHKELAEREGIDVLIGRARIVDERRRAIWSPTPPDPVTLADLMRLRSRWYAGRSILQPEAFFRLALFRVAGGVNIENHHSMDHELWMELAARGARFKSIDVLIASQLAHEGQKTADRVASLRAVMLGTRGVLRKHRAMLRHEAPEIESELDAIERKIEIADAVLPAWGGRDASSGSAAGDTSTSGDETESESIDAPEWAAAREKRACELLALAGASLLATPPVRVLGWGLSESDARVVRAALPNGFSLVATNAGERNTERFDLVIVGRHGASRDAVCEAWARVKAGGVLVLMPVPRRTPEIEAYAAWLRATLIGHLAANNGTLIDPRIDADLERFADAMHRVAGARSTRSRLGIDEREIALAMPNAETLRVLRFGGACDHPAMAFAFVGPQAVRPDATWIAGAWRKPLLIA
jgi:hypothetical protein